MKATRSPRRKARCPCGAWHVFGPCPACGECKYSLPYVAQLLLAVSLSARAGVKKTPLCRCGVDALERIERAIRNVRTLRFPPRTARDLRRLERFDLYAAVGGRRLTVAALAAQRASWTADGNARRRKLVDPPRVDRRGCGGPGAHRLAGERARALRRNAVEPARGLDARRRRG